MSYIAARNDAGPLAFSLDHKYCTMCTNYIADIPHAVWNCQLTTTHKNDFLSELLLVDQATHGLLLTLTEQDATTFLLGRGANCLPPSAWYVVQSLAVELIRKSTATYKIIKPTTTT